MTHRTTAAEERYFVQRVRHWAEFLSLGDWRISVYAADTGEDSGHCELWRDSHGAHIKINKRFPTKPSRVFLDKLALHEVAHVLLADLKKLINERCVTDILADTVEHAVIRRLENALTSRDD
jgi:hypothetical protein